MILMILQVPSFRLDGCENWGGCWEIWILMEKISAVVRKLGEPCKICQQNKHFAPLTELVD
jgi:hypothetical protein